MFYLVFNMRFFNDFDVTKKINGQKENRIEKKKIPFNYPTLSKYDVKFHHIILADPFLLLKEQVLNPTAEIYFLRGSHRECMSIFTSRVYTATRCVNKTFFFFFFFTLSLHSHSSSTFLSL
jgi:hypothetical protein